MNEFIQNFLFLLNQISLYILIGILLASILKMFLSDELIKKHLGEDSSRAIFKSALIGIPLPLCSCSVIPFATSLRKSGASKSAIQTFLISTPITGVDSILATFGAFGGVFTVFRVMASVVISIIAGFLTKFFDNENHKLNTQEEDTKSCCCNGSCSSEKQEEKKFNFIDYALNNLLKDFAKPLLIGLILGACLNIFLPKEISEFLETNQILGYFIVILISAPLYVCATASIPIGISLLNSGFSIGAVLIFLSAGPATSIITMSIVKNMLGTKSLLIYLFTIIFGSLAFGFLVDFIGIEFTKVILHEHEEFSKATYISSTILFLLLLYYVVPFKKMAKCCS